MPRRARIVYPGFPYHVTQRGNNRQCIFQSKDDYVLYLKRIEEYGKKYHVDIYAYCLMENHVHLILKPHKEDSLARMFRGVNMRYAQYYQKKTSISGHVWQGRFFSCLLCGTHLMESIRYVENNPVRANMVTNAWDYSWSSARAHTGKCYNWITLANINEIIEIKNWKQYLKDREDGDFSDRLREMTKRNLALGSKGFISKLERLMKRKIMPNPIGRPKNKK